VATIHSLAAAGRVERKRKLELQETDNKKASQSLHAHTTLSGLFSSRMFEARAIFQPCPGMSCDGAKHGQLTHAEGDMGLGRADFSRRPISVFHGAKSSIWTS